MDALRLIHRLAKYSSLVCIATLANLSTCNSDLSQLKYTSLMWNTMDKVRNSSFPTEPNEVRLIPNEPAECTGPVGNCYGILSGIMQSRGRSMTSTSGKTTNSDTTSVCYFELRMGQTDTMHHHLSKFGTDKVSIYGYNWAKEALIELTKALPEKLCLNVRSNESSGAVLEQLDINNPLTLKDLQLLARNEKSNVTGVINASLYTFITSAAMPEILALKDMVRQTVIVGPDFTKSYGGYGCSRHPQVAPVILVDLAALQFQRPENSGRLVLIQQNSSSVGTLDDFIYFQVVGEKKLGYEEAMKDTSGRYIPVRSSTFGGITLFDTIAYQRFVAKDFVLCAFAIEDTAARLIQTDKCINFKFLKYGAGFFAGDFRNVIERNILQGVLQGIDEFCSKSPADQRKIVQIELPFYDQPITTGEWDKTLQNLESKYGIKVQFSDRDALYSDSSSDLMVATSNCGDPHAACGNEMGYSSVDAAIASNIESQGNIFCPILNRCMNEKYI